MRDAVEVNNSAWNRTEGITDSMPSRNVAATDILPFGAYTDVFYSPGRGNLSSELSLPLADGNIPENVPASEEALTRISNPHTRVVTISETGVPLGLYRFPFSPQRRIAGVVRPVIAWILLSVTLLLFSLKFCTNMVNKRQVYVGSRHVGDIWREESPTRYVEEAYATRPEYKSMQGTSRWPLNLDIASKVRRLSESRRVDNRDSLQTHVSRSSPSSPVSPQSDVFLAEFCAETSQMLSGPEYLPSEAEWSSLFAVLEESTEMFRPVSSLFEELEQTSLLQTGTNKPESASAPSAIRKPSPAPQSPASRIDRSDQVTLFQMGAKELSSTSAAFAQTPPIEDPETWTSDIPQHMEEHSNYHQSPYGTKGSISAITGDLHVTLPISGAGLRHGTLTSSEEKQMPLATQSNAFAQDGEAGQQLAALFHIYRMVTAVQRSKSFSVVTQEGSVGLSSTPALESAAVELKRVPLSVLLSRKVDESTEGSSSSQDAPGMPIALDESPQSMAFGTSLFRSQRHSGSLEEATSYAAAVALATRAMRQEQPPRGIKWWKRGRAVLADPLVVRSLCTTLLNVPKLNGGARTERLTKLIPEWSVDINEIGKHGKTLLEIENVVKAMSLLARATLDIEECSDLLVHARHCLWQLSDFSYLSSIPGKRPFVKPKQFTLRMALTFVRVDILFRTTSLLPEVTKPDTWWNQMYAKLSLMQATGVVYKWRIPLPLLKAYQRAVFYLKFKQRPPSPLLEFITERAFSREFGQDFPLKQMWEN